MITTSVPTSSGYRLTGEKTSISNLGHASACIVLAQLEGRGVTAFYVPLDAGGITTGLFEDVGCRGIARGLCRSALRERKCQKRKQHLFHGRSSRQ